MVTLFWVCFSAAMRVSLLCRSLMSEYVYLFTITLSTNSPVSDVTTSVSSNVNRITSSSVWKQRILHKTSHSAVQRYYNRNHISTSPKLYSIISLTWEESWGDMSKFQNYSYMGGCRECAFKFESSLRRTQRLWLEFWCCRDYTISEQCVISLPWTACWIHGCFQFCTLLSCLWGRPEQLIPAPHFQNVISPSSAIPDWMLCISTIIQILKFKI